MPEYGTENTEGRIEKRNWGVKKSQDCSLIEQPWLDGKKLEC